MNLTLHLRHFFQIAKHSNSFDQLILTDSGLAKRTHLPYFSSIEREQNRRIWQVFERIVRRDLGQARSERIFSRYDLNPARMANRGIPLLAQHIEMIGVGAADIKTEDLSAIVRGKLRDLTPSEISEKVMQLNPDPYIGKLDLQAGISLSDLWGLVVHSPFRRDQERLHLCKDVHKIAHPHGYYERLAKSIVNTEMQEKTILPAPTSEGRIDYYEVYKKLTTGDGLIAYALKPLSKHSILKPLLLFRPTQTFIAYEDFIPTLQNDFEERIGEKGYLSARSILNDLQSDSLFCSPQEKMLVVGASLGGVHAQLFFSDFYEKIEQVIFFSDPSTDAATAEKLAEELNAIPLKGKKQLSILIYRIVNKERTRADLVTFTGEKHVGWGIHHPEIEVKLIEITPDNFNEMLPFEWHTRRFLDGENIQFEQRVYEGVDLLKELDNKNRGDHIFYYERLRRFLGSCFLLHLLETIYHFIGNLFRYCCGVEIFRKSVSR